MEIDRDMALILRNTIMKAQKRFGRAWEWCAGLSSSPPNDSGYPPPPLPCDFTGGFMMIVMVDNSKEKIMSNSEMAVIIGVVFMALGIIFMPF